MGALQDNVAREPIWVKLRACLSLFAYCLLILALPGPQLDSLNSPASAQLHIRLNNLQDLWRLRNRVITSACIRVRSRYSAIPWAWTSALICKPCRKL